MDTSLHHVIGRLEEFRNNADKWNGNDRAFRHQRRRSFASSSWPQKEPPEGNQTSCQVVIPHVVVVVVYEYSKRYRYRILASCVVDLVGSPSSSSTNTPRRRRRACSGTRTVQYLYLYCAVFVPYSKVQVCTVPYSYNMCLIVSVLHSNNRTVAFLPEST